MWSLAQYDYQTVNTSNGVSAFFWLLYLALIVVFIIAAWKIFEKAGQEGWKALIPIYNVIVLMRIVGFSGWYVLLFIIPIVNFVFEIIVAYRLAKSFGYGVGMTILVFIAGIGVLIMGFGQAKYVGPNGERSNKEV